MNVLHITAHLGGGVGKVLAGVIAESARRHDGDRHVVACLDIPEKRHFIDQVRSHGGEVLVRPSAHRLTQAITRADIVQLEWWHHPLVAGWMCAGVLPPMRMVVWSHVSGLHPPEIPPQFVSSPHRFLFTSPCSWEHPSLAGIRFQLKERAGVVFSSGGFDEFPTPPERLPGKALRVGYVGTLNFAKLHPQLLDFVAAVRLPKFRLALVGDPTGGADLMTQAAKAGLASRLSLRGYRTDMATELTGLDVMAYLLNPLHYGTTENALLEAMAMGVVPIVLNNPAERHLVRHDETGLIIDSPDSFADALDWLAMHPSDYARLSLNACHFVRGRFAVGQTVNNLYAHYQAVLTEEKRAFDFRPIFGVEPADWFRSCQGNEAWRFGSDDQLRTQAGRGPEFLYERTKSSVFHYRSVYETDERLARWAQQLEAA
jgi:L-malate glycosyltransferase